MNSLISQSILSFQESSGKVLDKWNIATRDEEQVILQQFLRFGETKSIAQEIILSDTRENREHHSPTSSGGGSTPKSESEIKKFIERSNLSIQQSYLRNYGTTAALLSRPTISAFPKSSASNSRMLSPTAVMQAAYSPGSANREALALTMHSPSPVSSSPLSRLQGMQPFDYRREHGSPTVSPVTSDKSLPPSSSMSSKSPENLSISASSSTSPGISASTGILTPVSTPKEDGPQDLRSPTSGGHPGSPSPDLVINYSTKVSPLDFVHHHVGLSTGSIYADKKVKHLRKSSNPMKRHWQPNPQFGQSFISPSGKKRVLCTACNKTFCDKGALKIHYSAVHLKEMHKCTVDGCNMMFSSRRSRNRHSANPNPKLHMPTNKRKLPDGAVLADETKGPVTPPPPPMMPMPSPLPPIGMPVAPMPINLPPMPIEIKPVEMPSPAPNVLPAEEQTYFPAPDAHKEAAMPSVAKIPKLDVSATNTTDLSSPTDAKNDIAPNSSGGSGRRKRKSNVPTRCAQPEEIFLADEHSAYDPMDPDAMMPQDLSVKQNMQNSNENNHVDNDIDMQNEGMDQDLNDSNNAFDREHPSMNDFHRIEDSAIRNMDNISQAKLRIMCDEEKGVYADEGIDMNDGQHGMSIEQARSLDDGSVSPNVSTPNTSISSVSSLNTNGHMSDGESDSEMYANHDDMANNNENNESDIPIDKENPKKCSGCGKIFPNHFSLKTHYQNVHLKLMHTCNVEGCNAAFPSKRSRDRHSSNLNLHRKLLSTSSSDLDKMTRGSLRDDFLPRIYDNQQYHNNALIQMYDIENARTSHLNSDTAEENMNGNNALPNGETSPHSPTPQQPSHEEKVEEPHVNNVNSTEHGMNGDEAVSPEPDTDGMVTCHICSQKFRDNLHLKEHFEKVHPKEMFHCTIKGCDKIFSTRKSRNRHSQNDNLHRHLSPSRI